MHGSRQLLTGEMLLRSKMGILCEILELQQPRIKSSMKGLARGALIAWSLL